MFSIEKIENETEQRHLERFIADAAMRGDRTNIQFIQTLVHPRGCGENVKNPP